MRHWIIATALVGTAMSSAACAQPAPDQAPTASKPDRRAMRHGDANGDGVVSRTEFLAQAGQRFDMMDANKDGQLSAEERKLVRERMRAERPHGPGGPPPGVALNGPPPPPPPPGAALPRGQFGAGAGGMLARLDANGDGKVTRAEYAAPFDLLDANKDGFVDQTERAAIPQGGAGGGGGARMARLDRDGDGKLTRAEFEAPFARIDGNNDGTIDGNEMQAIRARLGGGGRRFGGQGPLRSEAELQPQ